MNGDLPQGGLYRFTGGPDKARPTSEKHLLRFGVHPSNAARDAAVDTRPV